MNEAESWTGDKLRRKGEAEALLRFLRGRLEERRTRGVEASYVINVDAGWGHGKSYFLSNIQKDLIASGAAVALIDAWATDFSDDPLTAIMSGVDNALAPHLKAPKLKEAWQRVLKAGGSLAISLTKHIGAKLVGRYAGEFGDDLIDATFGTLPQSKTGAGAPPQDDQLGLAAASEELADKLADSALTRLIDAFRKQERSIATFKKQLSAVAAALNIEGEDFTPIYILVDELDRCRPTYALRMLESVKHLFNTSGVVFIIATDTEQLSESVKAVYGNNFESKEYLRRFFDRTYRFKEPSYQDFIEYLFDRSGIDREKFSCPDGLKPHQLASIILRDYGASLRDAEQCLDMLQTFYTMWSSEVPIEIGYALILICLYHSGRIEDFKLLSGQSKGSLENPIFSRATTIMRRRTGGFNEELKETKSSTNDLVSAYLEVQHRNLVKWAEDSVSQNLARKHVQSVMHAEFAKLHNNRYQVAEPPVSILRTYHRYVELAERLSEHSDG